MAGDESKELPDCSDYVEVDPTGRYGRYKDVLGKGASKTVYKAFDEYSGIEVAWNQVKLCDFLQSPDDLERLYCEIHLLKTLNHKHIMKFHTSWVDLSRRNINFITELFTSGTLRQYRERHSKVSLHAVKHWCRQILCGLVYLHSHQPPVIHRDLKCDNIFVNGHQGVVKIGDLGLAAILRNSHAVHCVGTPEFMAPEVYAEQYNELVDVYSFGMCILEMVTFEYPYSECAHQVEIYQKVVSGMKPDALYRVGDPATRQFIEKCLAPVSQRLSARELLEDPFLQLDDDGSMMSTNELCVNVLRKEFDDDDDDIRVYGIRQGDEAVVGLDVSIKGKRDDDGSIFMRLRIADEEGLVRYVHFHFDVDNDTALAVATEMVAELGIADDEVTRIADVIDRKVSKLVPGWNSGLDFDDAEVLASDEKSCENCLRLDASSSHTCECAAATHGRFEEIKFQSSEHDGTVRTDGELFRRLDSNVRSKNHRNLESFHLATNNSFRLNEKKATPSSQHCSYTDAVNSHITAPLPAASSTG